MVSVKIPLLDFVFVLRFHQRSACLWQAQGRWLEGVVLLHQSGGQALPAPIVQTFSSIDSSFCSLCTNTDTRGEGL